MLECRLDFASNEMEDAGFSVISRAIGHHTSLTLLDLSQNLISCTGMKSSMMYITALPNLQVRPQVGLLGPPELCQNSNSPAYVALVASRRTPDM